jgi:site-specific DNA recombinase
MEASMVVILNPLLKVSTYVSKKAKYARERDEIIPRNGCELVVGVVARISGGPRQKEASLEDQVDHAKEVVAEYYEGPVELRIISTRGKGERRNRPELNVLDELIRTRELDLLVAEDIGRIIRGADAVSICGLAVDAGTRVLAPNDCIDTNDPDWEEDVLSACRDHVKHNAHTSKRIKQKKQNRFRKFGGSTPCEIATYYKLEGATCFDDWRKYDEYTPTVQEGLRLLGETLNCSRVATYFNSEGLPLGNYNSTPDGKWTGRMVRRFFKNRMLGGWPGRGYRHTVKHHETGDRVSEVNPSGADFIECPHLAHVEIDELDRVNALLKEKNKILGRKKVNGVDVRFQVPRKTTVFPSQHARCYYCGFHHVRGANGITGNTMCANSRDSHCWNSVGVPCGMAGNAVIGAINEFLYELDGFESQFRELVEQAHRERVGTSAEQWTKLEKAEKRLEIQMGNIVEAMAEYGPTKRITAKQKELELLERQLASDRRALENLARRELILPSSIAELRAAFEKKATGLATVSPEFGDLMRLLAPEFHVYLVRLLDGGHPMPRARVKLDLTGCISDLAYVPSLCPLLTRVVTLDLFVPPERERIREEAVRLAASGLNQRDVAKRLSHPTSQPVVQKALALDRIMKERGLTTPYEILWEPPMDYPKMRRHQNARYEFRPLDGYERPQI